CSVCHTAEPDDNGGAQGPSLIGVYGRRAGIDPSFGYTKALQGSNLTWDEPTLNRFLAAPARVVPGTAMAVSVDDEEQRANLIAYLRNVRTARAGAPPAAAPAAQTTAESDWKQDAPGRRHRIDPAALPPPFSTTAARNPPRLVAKPPSAHLNV